MWIAQFKEIHVNLDEWALLFAFPIYLLAYIIKYKHNNDKTMSTQKLIFATLIIKSSQKFVSQEVIPTSLFTP